MCYIFLNQTMNLWKMLNILSEKTKHILSYVIIFCLKISKRKNYENCFFITSTRLSNCFSCTDTFYLFKSVIFILLFSVYTSLYLLLCLPLSTLPFPLCEYVFASTEYFPFCFLYLPSCCWGSVHCSHVIKLLILMRQRGSMSQAVARPLQHYITYSPCQSFILFYQLPHAASSPIISRFCHRIFLFVLNLHAICMFSYKYTQRYILSFIIYWCVL